MKLLRRSLPVAVVAAVVLVLSGCVAPSGSPQPSASSAAPTRSAPPSPTATSSRAATVRLGTAAISLLASDGSTVATIPTSSSPEQAIARLTAAIGSAPEVSQTAADQCSASYSIDDWDGALRIYHGTGYFLPAGYAFGFSSERAQTRHGTRVEGPGGIAVGESGTALLASTPKADIDTFLMHDGEAATVWLDLRGDPGPDQVGVVVSLSSISGRAPVRYISGPVLRVGEC